MSQSSYEILSIPRHLRYVVLIEMDYTAEKLLDLFARLCRLWGGKMIPIIPVENNSFTPEWKDLFSRYDPDYILRTTGVTEEFIVSQCYELGLNPVEILNIDESTSQIEGIYSGTLISIIDVFPGEKAKFIQGGDLWRFEHPLKPYYKLNYLLDDQYRFNKKMIGSHFIVDINKDNFNELNKIIGTSGFFNNIKLGCVNSYTTTVRPDPLERDFFELVFCREYAIQDLLYYWNKMLYSSSNRRISSLLFTIDQLEILLQDESFKMVLNSLPTLSHILHVVSLSLTELELQEVVSKLQAFTKHNIFRLMPTPVFPFKILDSTSPYKYGYKEVPSVQIIHSPNHLIYPPTLSFQDQITGVPIKWYVDVQVKELEASQKIIKFPMRCDARLIGRNPNSRIRRNYELTIEMNHEPRVATWQLDLPRFVTVFEQMVTRPKIINQRESKAAYSHCQYSDASNRLRNFLGLFNFDFPFLEEFLYDKFWFNLFEELTNNTRVEGDVITFDELFRKCKAIFDSFGGLKTRQESFRNEDNLRMGLQDIMQRLIDSKIFRPGFVIKCDSCSSNIWYSLAEISDHVICKGCSFSNNFRAEIPIGYKLNHLIKNNIGLRNEKGKFQPDGNLTVIRTLLSLRQKAFGNFEFLPQMDIFQQYHDQKPFTDLDVICLQNGKLIIGESKFNSEAFFGDNRQSLDKLLKIAELVKPNIVVVSCTVDASNKLDKAGKYLRHFIRKWPNGGPEVITYKTWEPTYNNLTGNNYFRY